MLASVLEIIGSPLLHIFSVSCPYQMPLHLSVISLIKTDERGYQGVWVEDLAYGVNQGRSFIHCKPIHP